LDKLNKDNIQNALSDKISCQRAIFDNIFYDNDNSKCEIDTNQSSTSKLSSHTPKSLKNNDKV